MYTFLTMLFLVAWHVLWSPWYTLKNHTIWWGVFEIGCFFLYIQTEAVRLRWTAYLLLNILNIFSFFSSRRKCGCVDASTVKRLQKTSSNPQNVVSGVSFCHLTTTQIMYYIVWAFCKLHILVICYLGKLIALSNVSRLV